MIEFFKETDCDISISISSSEAIGCPCAISLDKANRIFLERMKVGYTKLTSQGFISEITDVKCEDFDTHKIYYITEEIEKPDTAESLLREIISNKDDKTYTITYSWFEKVKAYLENKGGE